MSSNLTVSAIYDDNLSTRELVIFSFIHAGLMDFEKLLSNKMCGFELTRKGINRREAWGLMQTAYDIESRLLAIDGLTLVTITHNLSNDLLKLYDQIVYMEDGCA